MPFCFKVFGFIWYANLTRPICARQRLATTQMDTQAAPARDYRMY